MSIGIVAGDRETFAQPTLSRELRIRPCQVLESPRMAWANTHQHPYDYLPADLVTAYRDPLDDAATRLYEPQLVACWERHGFHVVLASDAAVIASDGPTDATYALVRDEAAQLVDPDQVVSTAGLDDIRHLY